MKTLKDVVKIVQHELDCSISELSRKLGKSRNYLFTHLKNGLSAEKEQEIINSLLELVDDENRMLRNVVSEQEETITAYRLKFKEMINEGLNEVEEKNNTISHLHERLISTSRACNKKTESQNATIVELNNTIATKDLSIDGKDTEIEKLNKSLNSYRSLSDAQAGVVEKLKVENKEARKAMNDGSDTIGKVNNHILKQDEFIEKLIIDISKEKQKTRTLSLGIIAIAVVSTIALWWLS